MKRREFITALGVAATWPFAAWAQRGPPPKACRPANWLRELFWDLSRTRLFPI
jgi:hypothetical protein